MVRAGSGHLGAGLLTGQEGLRIGNESVPIQLTQCWFPGLAISNAKTHTHTPV